MTNSNKPTPAPRRFDPSAMSGSTASSGQTPPPLPDTGAAPSSSANQTASTVAGVAATGAAAAGAVASGSASSGKFDPSMSTNSQANTSSAQSSVGHAVGSETYQARPVSGADQQGQISLEAISAAASGATGVTNTAKDAAGNAVDAAGNAVGGAVDAAGNAVGGAVDAAGNAVGGAVDAAGNAVGGAVDAAGNAVGGAVDAAGNAVGGAVDAAGNAVGGAVDAAGNAVGGAVDAAGNAVGGAVDAAGNAVGDAVDAAGNAVGGAVDAAGNAVGGAVDAAGNAVGGAVDAASDGAGQLGSAATGAIAAAGAGIAGVAGAAAASAADSTDDSVRPIGVSPGAANAPAPAARHGGFGDAASLVAPRGEQLSAPVAEIMPPQTSAAAHALTTASSELSDRIDTLSQEVSADLARKIDANDPQAVEKLISEIDMGNSSSIIFFGTKAQEQLTEVSDTMLETVRTKDVGPAGDALNSMVGKLRELDVTDLDPNDKPGWLRRLFGAKSAVEGYLDKYDTIKDQIEEISQGLEKHKTNLLTDVTKLDKLYDANLEYYHNLELYIEAGKTKLAELDESVIPALADEVVASTDTLRAQQLRDLRAARDDLERRVHDLMLTRQVTMQSLPSIRLVQENDKSLINKINSTLANTVPLWRQQLAQSITIYRSGQAAKAVTAATDLTNDLLKKNADNLREVNAQVRKEVERGVFDIATVKEANDTLIATIEDSLRIADEGKAKRAEAEKTLVECEAQLKQALAAASARAKEAGIEAPTPAA